MELQKKSLRIFIIDNDEILCRLAQKVLEGYHVVHADIEEKIAFDVQCFDSAESFLSALPAGEPDILLLENKLPGKSGLSLLEELNRSRRRICTIITASDGATIEKAIQTLKLGAYDFLAKPFSQVKLRFHVYKAARFIILTRKAQRLAQEKKRVRFETVSVLAHELKAPINALESYTDIIRNKRSGESVNDYGVMLDRMLIRIQGMRKLINDLLDLTSLELAERQRHLVKLDITAIARETAERLKEETAAGNVRINLKTEHPVMFEADYDDMEMVMRNLMSNAIKYNRTDGSVTVGLEPDDSGVTIEVSDTGIGMSKEEQSHLFKEFSRIKNEQTMNITGSGLGLSIVKKIATLYNGDVSVESEKENGTTFRVKLKARG
jgi:two-component system sensor histidine kinase/response regulator